MEIAMIVCQDSPEQDSPEVVWSAFRLANMMLKGMEKATGQSLFTPMPAMEKRFRIVRPAQ